MNTNLAQVKLNTVVVFDATFNHPAMRDITVGKGYTIAGMTDDDDPQPYIIDDSGDQNARALQICEFKIQQAPEANVSKPKKRAAKRTRTALTATSRYLISFTVCMNKDYVHAYNTTLTVENNISADEILRLAQEAALKQIKATDELIHINGMFKL